MAESVEIYNREARRVEREPVYGERFLRWAYGNPVGRASVALAFQRRWFSLWYGWRMSRPASRARIAPFVREFGLDASEFAAPTESYESFDAFFRRRLKPGARPVAGGPGVAVFPADGRHLAIPEVGEATRFHVKGQSFDLARFLDNFSLATRYRRGAMLISRLGPTDCHRFHFPADGVPESASWLPGTLRSVSPYALRRRLAILWENRRCLTRFRTDAFGDILMAEVGATCVGRIEQTYRSERPVARGDEKGFFGFGASCVITLFPPGALRFDGDLLEQSAVLRETYARMGDRFGEARLG